MVNGRRILQKNNSKSRKKIIQKPQKETHNHNTDNIEELELLKLKNNFYRLIKKNIQLLDQDIDINQSKYKRVGEPKINIEIQKESKYIDGFEVTQIIGVADVEREITLQDKILYVNQLLPFSVTKIKEK